MDEHQGEQSSIDEETKSNEDINLGELIQAPSINPQEQQSTDAAIRFDTLQSQENVYLTDYGISQDIAFSSDLEINIEAFGTQPVSTISESVEEKFPTKVSTGKRKKKWAKHKIFLKEEKIEEPNENNWDVPINSITLNFNDRVVDIHHENVELKYINQGQFGSVHSVKVLGHDSLLMAVKCMPLITREDRAYITRNELKMMEEFGFGACPYLIGYFGAIISTLNSELWIFMELMNMSMKQFYVRMHLMTVINPNNIDFLLRRIIHNLASALEFLAERNFIHRDVKPDNILVNENGVFKLGDYGLCCNFDEMNLSPGDRLGTADYLPLELWQYPPAPSSIQSDMWALGISLLEIINGRHPCPYPNSFERNFMLEAWTPKFSSNMIADDIRNLILYLLGTYPQARPESYEEILKIDRIRDLPEEPTLDEINFIIDIMNHRQSTID